jgi:hypothetical protein
LGGKKLQNWLNISLIWNCCKKLFAKQLFSSEEISINEWVRQSCDKFLGRARSSPHPKGIALFG